MTDPVQPAPILLRQPKEPPTLRGFSFEDPESWLEAYDLVALFNICTSEDKLRHVYFALEDAARTWFENQEQTLTTWDVSRTRFLAPFISVVRKERAEALLETRMQMPNENVALFTEEMTRLFRHAEPVMPKDKKVRFIKREVKQIFAGLMRNPPSTVQEFVSETTAIEKILQIRTRQYNRRSMQDSPAVHALGSDDLRETIRAIMREEQRKLFPSPHPQGDSTEDIV